MSVVATSSAASASLGGRFALLLGLLGAPIFIYLIVRTAIVALSPSASVGLPPSDYTPVIGQLLPAFADPRVPVPPQVVQMAERAARSSPLSEEPYFVFARRAGDAGRLQEAVVLMEEARRRHPNFLPTRLLLMAYYGQSKRFPEALAEMEYTMKSSEGVRQIVLPELAKAIDDPDGRQALAAVLARGPGWRDEFVHAAVARKVRPEQARELLELVRARAPRLDLAPERSLYLQALVNAGRVAEARSVWLQLFPEAERQRHQYVFDGAFTGRKAPPPFGWLMHDSDVGRGEIVRSGQSGGYLEVSYFGGRNVTVAEQMLALAPGAYLLSFRAKSDSGVRSGQLYVKIGCTQGSEAGRVVVANPQAGYRNYQGAVRVPAGCSGQKLEVITEAGDVASTYTVQIADLRMIRQ
jgi:hypothetical protein